MLGELRQVLEKRHRGKVDSRQERNPQIVRPLAGLLVHPGDSMVGSDSDSSIYNYEDNDKLDHEKWTSP